MIIGITGGTGCGKSTLLEMIRQQGGLVLDCDAIYHELLKTDPSLLCAIENRFPGTVEDGVLDRKKLGNIVFADAEALADLNAITHKAVKDEVIRRIEGTDRSIPNTIAIDAYGLFEGGLAELCAVTVAVVAPAEDRIRRLMARDAITEDYARSRIAAQRSNEEFSSLCQYTLHNNGSLEDFQSKCLAFLQEIGII
ncbi:MAG: dephospho-CoA kinase [Oscillospiraceae bacterium]|nr:dephospho-CoA kinase [Oscillospiraceae bacterium]